MRNLLPLLNLNFSPGITLQALERDWIVSSLKFYQYNKTRTAQALGISIRTLDNKIKEYEDAAIDAADRAAAERADRAATLDKMRGPFITQYNGLGSANQLFPRAETPARIQMEPIANDTRQQAMPMPERQEVQEVLPSKSAGGGHGKRR